MLGRPPYRGKRALPDAEIDGAVSGRQADSGTWRGLSASSVIRIDPRPSVRRQRTNLATNERIVLVGDDGVDFRKNLRRLANLQSGEKIICDFKWLNRNWLFS